MRFKLTWAALALILLSSQVHGQSQTLDLRSGEIVIGRVAEVNDREIVVETGYPEPVTRTVPRGDLAPLSLYSLMAMRSDPADAKAHVKLAQLARELGLPAQAIAEYREAGRLEPSLKGAMETAATEVRRALAADLLDDAREAMNDGRLAAARLLLHAIASKYADTPAAKDAGVLTAELRTKEQPALAGTKILPPKEVEAAMKRANDHEKRADSVGEASPHGGAKEQRRLEAAVGHLESAWAAVKGVGGAEGDPGLTDRLLRQREEIRRTLTGAYLAIGTVLVERRALPGADSYCEKACELDPENKDSHALHGLILQAKISRGYGRARGK
jgi:tetratricopeptide (TPR) repeat protein